ncbi:hypothetical protein AVEN_220833-1 [Araneus ventricosus]|uniref:Uncharacterized protein n=1 Tax=Araneus ventricosus TaxID=182803 RepID=A0A4Y2FRW8_ARAVE|nr:hypothetical protein AVEN_220833-1 [Araneus ventricosus]
MISPLHVNGVMALYTIRVFSPSIRANCKPICFGSLRSPTASTSYPGFKARTSPAPISHGARMPSPSFTYYTGHISAFMARQSKWSTWILRLIRNPNCFNFHRFFAL